MVFEINKCSNVTKTKDEEKCKTPEEINEFVKRIQVNTWSNYYVPDFRNHNTSIYSDEAARSAVRVEKWQAYSLLNPDRLI